MKLLFTEHFNRAYKKAPQRIRDAFDNDKWQARVTGDWRSIFELLMTLTF